MNRLLYFERRINVERKNIDYMKYAKKTRKVYNRKILRNMLKKQVGSNKIQQAWHYLQVTNWGRRTKNESRV